MEAYELVAENKGLKHELTLLREAYTRLNEVHDGAMAMWKAEDDEIERIRAERDALRAALTSIANNTCCGGCGEAALVAQAALRGEE